MDPPLPLPPNFPLPHLHASLAPYIRPRPEATQIRQAVAAYFSDLVEAVECGGVEMYEGDEGRFVNEVGGGMLGRGLLRRGMGGGGGKGGKGDGMGGERLRLEYLLALRGNVLARREWEGVAEKGSAREANSDSEEDGDEDEDGDDHGDGEGEEDGYWDPADIDTYGLRKGKGRLAEAREFLDLYASMWLVGRQGGRVKVLEGGVRGFPTPNPPTAAAASTSTIPGGSGGGGGGVKKFDIPFPQPPASVIGAGSEGAVSAISDTNNNNTNSNINNNTTTASKIIVPLETAIYTAHRTLLREKALLEDVKQRVSMLDQDESGSGGSDQLPQGVGDKRKALERANAELVGWMEERLGWSAPPPEEGGGDGGEVGGEEVRQRVKGEVEKWYGEYLQARERIVGLVGMVGGGDRGKAGSGGSGGILSTTTTPTQTIPPNYTPLPPTPTLPLLPLLTHTLPTLLRLQKSLHATKNHLSTTLLKARDTSTHDILALTRASPVVTETFDISGVSAPVDLLRCWFEAVKVRRARVGDEVGAKMAEAEDVVRGKVDRVVRDLEGLLEVELGVGGEEAAAEREKKAIPVRSGAAAAGGRGKGGRGAAGAGGAGGGQATQEKKGLWAGLDGGIGVIGDGI